MKRFLFYLSVASIITYAVSSMALNTWDKHMFAGVDVVGYENGVVLVDFDAPYKKGSDGSCYEAGQILLNVAFQAGKVKVVPKTGTWSPLHSTVWTYESLSEHLDNIEGAY